jgi:hypothetical protein
VTARSLITTRLTLGRPSLGQACPQHYERCTNSLTQFEADTMTATTNETFRLSRIYAEGWNMANRLATREVETLDFRKLATLNPYSLEPDRTRWTSGFTEALTEERPVTKLRKRP